jgi:hypothetical protein
VPINTSLQAAEQSTICDYSGCQELQLKLVKEPTVTGFSTSQVWEVVEDILQISGLAPNFEVSASNEVGNAAALIRNGQRYLAYNKNWMSRLKGDEMTSWRLYAVMAHEIGHHLQGHTLDSRGSHPKIELEADNYAGFILAGLGASLKEALVLWQGLSKSGSSTHPARKDRLLAVTKGWQRWHTLIANVTKGRGQNSESNSHKTPTLPSNTKNASNYLLSFSAHSLVVADDIAGFDQSKIRLARNEIFARHGYAFNSKELTSYFSQYDWYQARGKNVSLSMVEKANVAFLRTKERQKNSERGQVKSNHQQYLYPASSSRLLSSSELSSYSTKQLRYIRNEIFARHGYLFKSADLNQYFRSQPWYKAQGKSISLSEIEQLNVILIKGLENE